MEPAVGAGVVGVLGLGAGPRIPIPGMAMPRVAWVESGQMVVILGMMTEVVGIEESIVGMGIGI
jgi:hypothetical protein